MGRLAFVREAVERWDRLEPDLNTQALGIGQRILWVGRVLEELLERSTSEEGFRSITDYELLAVLVRGYPHKLTPVELARELRLSPSGVTGKLDRLEDQGLVSRTRSVDDRRTLILEVTEEGQRRVLATVRRRIVVYEAMSADLTDDQVSNLSALLDTVLTRLDQVI